MGRPRTREGSARPIMAPIGAAVGGSSMRTLRSSFDRRWRMSAAAVTALWLVLGIGRGANAQEDTVARKAEAATNTEAPKAPDAAGASTGTLQAAQPQPSNPTGEGDIVNQCVYAHAAAQELLRTDDLLESADALGRCSDARCPDVVRADCLGWTDELQRRIPSVVFRFTVDGTDRRAVNLYLDGKKLFDQLPTRALQLNPGRHTFMFVYPGLPQIERVLTIRQGETYRPVEVEVESPAQTEPVSTTTAATKTGPPPVSKVRTVESRPVPWTVYALGGIGVAGGLGFAALGLAATSLERDLRDSCSPNCSKSQVDDVRTRETLADVSLGVGVAGLVAAGAVYLTRPSKTVRVDAGALPTGGIYGRVAWVWE